MRDTLRVLVPNWHVVTPVIWAVRGSYWKYCIVSIKISLYIIYIWYSYTLQFLDRNTQPSKSLIHNYHSILYIFIILPWLMKGEATLSFKFYHYFHDHLQWFNLLFEKYITVETSFRHGYKMLSPWVSEVHCIHFSIKTQSDLYCVVFLLQWQQLGFVLVEVTGCAPPITEHRECNFQAGIAEVITTQVLGLFSS